MTASELYPLVAAKAIEIETELRRLGRWSDVPLAPEQYDDIGAFGANKMTFEQWIQFILLVRIKTIIDEKDEFPSSSNVGAYAVRNFDGDYDADGLTQLLSELDELIEPIMGNWPRVAGASQNENYVAPSGYNLPLPEVVYQLAKLFPTLEGEALESQLQTFDVFLATATDEGRTIISQLLSKAALEGKTVKERLRLNAAATDVMRGGTAAPPYNHAEAMKKYQEEFRKNFPNAPI